MTQPPNIPTPRTEEIYKFAPWQRQGQYRALCSQLEREVIQLTDKLNSITPIKNSDIRLVRDQTLKIQELTAQVEELRQLAQQLVLCLEHNGISLPVLKDCTFESQITGEPANDLYVETLTKYQQLKDANPQTP